MYRLLVKCKNRWLTGRIVYESEAMAVQRARKMEKAGHTVKVVSAEY